MKINIFEKGFNYSQDGTGNRLVYHLQGCNMHCPWCANPEGVSVTPTLFVNEKMLVNSICPYSAVHDHRLDRSVCKSCSDRPCIYQNKNQGIVCKCKSCEIDEILAEVRKNVPMFFDSGGVTLTGGEPTCQFKAVKVLLSRFKSAGIHTAVETNGTHPRLPELLPLIDQLMIDFKHPDDKIHRAVTGIGNQTIKENITKANILKKPIDIRVPLIGGFNTSEEALQGMIAFIKTLDTDFFTVELLRYHEYGKPKWHACGLEYIMDGTAQISAEILTRFRDAFLACGFQVIRT
ncbi:MAG TPA: glycyl-radical enzyme activating protein [Oscillospiraceae bacterium]|nr:glycyl-radical enzyme activating protein [Oscillospiraceae bacterium]HPS35512.1 glycyl-radical enzyme activating protein [Oscillospiraceae bacterium]